MDYFGLAMTFGVLATAATILWFFSRRNPDVDLGYHPHFMYEDALCVASVVACVLVMLFVTYMCVESGLLI